MAIAVVGLGGLGVNDVTIAALRRATVYEVDMSTEIGFALFLMLITLTHLLF